MANRALERFLEVGLSMPAPRVIELGTLQSMPGRSTMHQEWFPGAREWVGVDIERGQDVDVVADIHELSSVLGRENVDLIVSCSTFEHLKYPFVAAHELMKCLTIGGALFIQTHQSFPLHAYPCDFFRFSTDGLAALFGTRMGFETLASEYEFEAKIVSSETSSDAPAWLNTCLCGRKTDHTPDDYVYELGVNGT